MDTGLTTISEADIEKHRATAQSMITRLVVLEDASRDSATQLAGTGRNAGRVVTAALAWQGDPAFLREKGLSTPDWLDDGVTP